MTTQTLKLMTFGMFGQQAASRRSGWVGKGRTAVLKGLGGSEVRCTSGSLWVTLEGDTRDYVLRANECLTVPNLGKVLLSGPGSYQV